MYKHQTQCYRIGGEYVCWCDAYDIEHAKRIVQRIRKDGFSVKRVKDRVFVKAGDFTKIPSTYFEEE